MIKGIIFDLDGTLLYTIKDLTNAVNYALKLDGLKPITIKQGKAFIGNGVTKLVERALTYNNVDYNETTLANFKKYYDMHQNDNTKVYKGVYRLIRKLYKLGYHMAIVSNKYQSGVDNLCKPLFKNYIDVYVGSNSNMKLKPASDMVDYAISSMNLNKSECIYVGDSEVDYQTAINANLKHVLVSYGYRTKKQLVKLKPDYLINKPSNLLKVIKEINNE